MIIPSNLRGKEKIKDNFFGYRVSKKMQVEAVTSPPQGHKITGGVYGSPSPLISTSCSSDLLPEPLTEPAEVLS